MNANTANAINDAVAQAIHCGEDPGAVLAQVDRALRRALEARRAEGIRRLTEEHERLVATHCLDEA